MNCPQIIEKAQVRVHFSPTAILCVAPSHTAFFPLLPEVAGESFVLSRSAGGCQVIRRWFANRWQETTAHQGYLSLSNMVLGQTTFN